MKIYDDLIYRGLIKDISDPSLAEKLNTGGLTFYIGTDPTGDSLHIGHFSSFLITTRLKKAGHKPILLIGGATALIGDPKPTAERKIVSKEEVARNVECLTKQAQKIFGCETVNNFDWCQNINFLDFLRDYGKYFNLNYMLDKDIIKKRLEEGITYTEFSYMIIQSLDFLHLYETRNCTLQVAGQDQWGNITAGIELIRKKTGKKAYAFTMPLLTKANGTKFGKTEGNAIWLDKEKTTPYEMYQFFINSEDEMVIDYLKKLTFLSKEEIEAIKQEHLKFPEKRIAHKKLAEEVITFLHGHEEFENALKISTSLFSEEIVNLPVQEILSNFQAVPHFEINQSYNIVEFLSEYQICSSKREAREMLTSGAISVNNQKLTGFEFLISRQNAIEKQLLVIKKGKKNYYLVIFSD